jgi:hypothetical protein
MVLRRSILCALALACLCTGASAAMSDDVPLDEYLRALERLTPAARDGAEAYMTAFEKKCRRPMRTIELRTAVSEGNGDPILMAMIRASHYKDLSVLESLATAVSCPAGKY